MKQIKQKNDTLGVERTQKRKNTENKFRLKIESFQYLEFFRIFRIYRIFSIYFNYNLRTQTIYNLLWTVKSLRPQHTNPDKCSWITHYIYQFILLNLIHTLVYISVLWKLLETQSERFGTRQILRSFYKITVLGVIHRAAYNVSAS